MVGLAGSQVALGDPFLGLPQGGLRSFEIGVGFQRFGDQAVEFAGVKHFPPLPRNIAADLETLPRAARNVGGCRRRGFALGRIARYRRRLRVEATLDGTLALLRRRA